MNTKQGDDIDTNVVLAQVANKAREYYDQLLEEAGIEAAYYRLYIELRIDSIDSSFSEVLKTNKLIDESSK